MIRLLKYFKHSKGINSPRTAQYKSPTAHLVIREVKAVLIFLISSFRQLELHSPDTRHTVVLRCPDQPSALSWFAAMHSVTSSLAQVWLLLHRFCGLFASRRDRTLWLLRVTSDVIHHVSSPRQWALAEVVQNTARMGIVGSKEIRHLGWLAGKVGMCVLLCEMRMKYPPVQGVFAFPWLPACFHYQDPFSECCFLMF